MANNEQNSRDFHIGDILSITTGRLVSPRHMTGVYDILNYMTGDDLYTTQLPRAARECAPELLRQHPDLADVEVPETLSGMDDVKRWLGSIATEYGESRAVTPMPEGQHSFINVIQELIDQGLGDKLIVIQPDSPEEA